MFVLNKKIKLIFVLILLIFINFCFAKKLNVDDFDLVNFYIEKNDSDADKFDLLENKEEAAIVAQEILEKVVPVKVEINSIIHNDVDFISQAPFGEWDDPRQQDGCEEAASIMAVYWAQNKKLDKITGKEELLKIFEYQEKNYKNYIDTSVEDTAKIILEEYFNFNNYEIKDIILSDDLLASLGNDRVVIIPTNGRLLGNPHYTQPGPERHNLLVIGYDYEADEFITNDPGTRHGKNFRYNREILFDAIIDYPSGNHRPLISEQKRVIIIKK